MERGEEGMEKRRGGDWRRMEKNGAWSMESWDGKGVKREEKG